MMSGSDGKTTRPWQEIAAEASCEKNSKRLLALTKELELAMDERDEQLQRPYQGKGQKRIWLVRALPAQPDL